ncbi:peptide ligase PGM1-related protein [Frankia sp. AgKG'84/4]|uniref:peptide ligase PGM1-related protein n=1 Tax=Frankia sp. AgKG'84/4 TaxID=573490 RepID=UPI002029C204|nr:peptide ligase PGM1-related protein [Frankia sp. AgKG'84/4]MCL9794406.1 peptide ligase PGM1-related protein [Frankia sp. AgKG'84/4]
MTPSSGIVDTKIVLYSFNFAEKLLREVSYLRFSAERGLCYLEELRREDLQLVLITSTEVSQAALDYHFREIFGFSEAQISSATSRLRLLSPALREGWPLDASVLADAEVMSALSSIVENSRSTSIVNFMATPTSDRIAAILGATIEEQGAAAAAETGSKLGGKSLLKRAGVRVPEGPAELLADERAVLAGIVRIDPSSAVVKLNSAHWTAGVGNIVVDVESVRRGRGLFESAESVRLPAEDFWRELAAEGAVVEEFVDDVVASPSGLGHINADGTVDTGPTHEQILVSGQYWGCRFPAEEGWRSGVLAATARVGRTLAEGGVRGTFGIDFVVSGNGGLFAVEVNLRKVGTTHVVKYIEKVVGAEIDAGGRLRPGGGPDVFYVNGRMQESALVGVAGETVLDLLRKEGLLYRQELGEGVLLHCLGALPACGYLELTSVAGSRARAADLIQAAQDVVVGSVAAPGGAVDPR